jgi:signal peptidase I
MLNICIRISLQLSLCRQPILSSCVLLVLSLIQTPALSQAQTPPVASLYIVKSPSMDPNLRQYDIVVADRSVPFDSLKKGDIIVFRTAGTTDEGQHEIIAHRVAQIVTDNQGLRVIRTKGDANTESIPFLDYPIREQNYLGKVMYVLASNESSILKGVLNKSGSTE